jgi:hypothetical protein
VGVVAAGVHHTYLLTAIFGPGLGLERQIDLFGDRQCIHIGAQRDGRAGSGTFQQRRDPGDANAGLHLQIERLQALGDDLGGAHFAVAELRIRMKIAPPLDDFVVDGLGGSVELACADVSQRRGGEQQSWQSGEAGTSEPGARRRGAVHGRLPC